MKWIENLEAIASNKEPGECPICKSKNTDYGFNVIVKETNMVMVLFGATIVIMVTTFQELKSKKI